MRTTSKRPEGLFVTLFTLRNISSKYFWSLNYLGLQSFSMQMVAWDSYYHEHINSCISNKNADILEGSFEFYLQYDNCIYLKLFSF
jgi:hypothetical protein